MESALGQAGSVEDAVMGADAVLVLTEWQHYRAERFGSGRQDAQAGQADARAVADPLRSKPLASALLAKETVDGTHCFGHRSCFIGAALARLLQQETGLLPSIT